MFDRSVLFVGAEGIGLAMLAEALALDCTRLSAGPLPLRVYSATSSDAAQSDPVMLRAMDRLKLDTKGLSLKPLALYAFAGAPRLDHVILLNAELPAATKLALGETLDVRHWDIDMNAADEDAMSPGARYNNYLSLAERLKPRVQNLVDELTDLSGLADEPFAHSA
ncbi:MAG: hypothetical protein AB8B88_06930 [Devosiaceae bacterium]